MNLVLLVMIRYPMAVKTDIPLDGVKYFEMVALYTLIFIVAYVVFVPYLFKNVRNKGIKALLFLILIGSCAKLGIECGRAIFMPGLRKSWVTTQTEG